MSLTACITFVVTYYLIVAIENVNINKNFNLNNSNKYILNKEVTNENKGYYEIDFEKK